MINNYWILGVFLVIVLIFVGKKFLSTYSKSQVLKPEDKGPAIMAGSAVGVLLAYAMPTEDEFTSHIDGSGKYLVIMIKDEKRNFYYSIQKKYVEFEHFLTGKKSKVSFSKLDESTVRDAVKNIGVIA